MSSSIVADMTPAFLECVELRAADVGFIPYGFLLRLTADEWARIRMMTQGEARHVLRLLEGHVDPSRTKTPTISPDTLERLLRL